MMQLYNNTANEISKRITRRYSTSFSLGIQMLHKKIHTPIYSIYGFVRLADEIVDTFHDYNKETLLKRFIQQTWEALNEGISTNPVLHSFQLTVHKYNIDYDLIKAFLHSMEMDLYKNKYNNGTYGEYIYGSAEVVGLMCLKVFCNGNEAEYNRLTEPARKLGAAFQKVNFLRDIKSDYEERGRTYFPEVDFSSFNDPEKKKVEFEIEKDFNEAYEGIKQLPKNARFGVYVAYIYYQSLFRKIKKLPAKTIQYERVRVPNKEKAALLLTSWLRFRFNFL